MNTAVIAAEPPVAVKRRFALGEMPPLALAWRRLARRFNARPQRERLMLIAAGVGIAFMLADQLWLGTALRDFGRARTEQRQAQTSFADVQAQTEHGLTAEQVKSAQMRAEIASWRQRVRQGDAALKAYEDALVGPDQMLPLLEQMLARHAGLRVRGMRSLERTDLLATARADAATAKGKGQAAAEAAPATTLYRHGIELTLEGSFAELLAYLRALEALPQRLLWGGAKLEASQSPKCTLTLHLYTLSRERHFLEI